MKILVLGATGMLGHKVYQVLKRSDHKILATTRKDIEYKFYNKESIIKGFDAYKDSIVKRIVTELRPNIIINCIGIIKPLVKDYINTIYINSLFPHKLADLCSATKSKLIHISTDCVFSGEKGDYKETDLPDAEDLYGRSKLLGEVTYKNHLTIRTSIIGRELDTKNNLLEWFLQQKDEVNGYENAIWSGLTTIQLSKVILKLIEEHPELSGLVHIYGEKISKYTLLCILNKQLNRNLKVKRFRNFYCDRSLKSDIFPNLGITIPSMKEMIKEMFSDEENTYYNDL